MSKHSKDRMNRSDMQNHNDSFSIRYPYQEGPNFTLVDKKLLYAFARFCHMFGGICTRPHTPNHPVRDVSAHPNRILIIDNQTGRIIEDVDDIA